MKVVGVSVPVLTRDIDRAIPYYEALTGERVKARFVVPGRGLKVALLGRVTLISGDEEALTPMRELRATFLVDSIAEFEAHLRSRGGTILQAPAPTPAGRNMVARDIEGTVFEFVEPSVASASTEGNHGRPQS
jgi:predicted enzyme related to lactoylglutathione lyase